jgi:hypothetical protein
VGGCGDDDAQFAAPWEADSHQKNRIYVTDYGNDRVQVFLYPRGPRRREAVSTAEQPDAPLKRRRTSRREDPGRRSAAGSFDRCLRAARQAPKRRDCAPTLAGVVGGPAPTTSAARAAHPQGKVARCHVAGKGATRHFVELAVGFCRIPTGIPTAGMGSR